MHAAGGAIADGPARRRRRKPIVDDLAATRRQHRHRASRAAARGHARDRRAGRGDRARRRSPTAPTCCCSARPTRSRRTRRRGRSRRRSRNGARGRLRASSLSWRGWSRSSRRAGPSPTASRPPSPGAPRTGSTRSSARATESSGALHLPPQRVSREGGAIDDMEPAPMGDVAGTIATFTIDRIAYSPSPPIVFAVVDFDGGGRLPVELTDVDADDAHDRRPGRDDVPQAVHRRRHPQLLLEGPPDPIRPAGRRIGGAHGLARHQGPGRDRRHGLHPLRRALGQGRRRPPHRRLRARRSRRPASTRTTSTRSGSAPRCRA